MIDGLMPYASYRTSAHPWLGAVPAHWAEKRAKCFFREIDERSTTGKEELLSVSHKTGVTPRPQHVTMFKAESNIGHKICRPADLAINTMWAFMGALGVSRQLGVVSPAYGVYRPINDGELQPKYVDHLLRTDVYKSEYLCRSTGIRSSRLRLYPEQFLRIPILCPPPEEQAAIVRFLDHADRRIRRYIRAKRQLIALLNEQKQAIIHCAVTRGLDPHVKLKPSGVEWLGDVPEHWGRLRLKDVAHIQTGITLGKSYRGVEVVDRPYLRVANVQAGHVDLSEIKTVSVPRSEIDGSELNAGDVLMTEGGDIDKLGRGCIWRGEIEGCLHQNHVFAVRPDQKRLLPEFLALVTESRHGRSYFEVTAKKTTNLAATNSTKVREFPLFLPSVFEQTLILKEVDEKAAVIREALAQAEHELNLLRDYRTRLIADVITGKLNVQVAAAALPDELDEVEPDTEELLDESDMTDDAGLDTEPEEIEA